jgi:protein-disulfide isomerase/uncharacterized membrane protein
MRRKLLVFIGIMCGVATVLAVMSTTQHFRIAKFGLEFASFCAISDTINCDIVNASSYSEFLGVPIAWWGTVYYGLLAVMCFFGAFSKRERRATVSIAWFMALSGIPYVLFLFYISWAVLGAFCVECIGMYAASLIAAVGLCFSLKLRLKEIPAYILNYFKALFGKAHELGFDPKIRTHVIIIAVVYGIAWLGIAVYQTKGMAGFKKVDADKEVRNFYAQSAYPIEVSPHWAVWGNPDAKVKLIEFSEFQCPFCRRASFTVKPFLQQFRKDVALYFVNFPLDNACNPLLDRPMHPDSCYFAKAAICANRMGNFWDYQEALFLNQKGLNRKKALDIAQDKFGWDRTAFQQCISSEETEAELKAEIQAGLELKISGTPSFYLDGRHIRNWVNKKFIQTIVKEEIQKSRDER